ncbi:succinate dehydrogenase cytochrome b556 subunit [Vibrio rumoiensis]|uniref:Succinate dehydrogenase cytochrome b556 subunit n=1 Tax=Vibrio rumoiensis 1S-45 TaxID=1188252 RepID=A0A1E5E199_9VIBR|nr:succinate dehydrogenase cytochrome b556 subunit [Vibrio rumoiensis]OEF24028.1 succinate dehydrogenase cytochrome b556 large subunit [Vibrio rumoiensis 1S-45]
MSTPVKKRKSRPVNLDLQTIHFPISAIASIVHRVSGVIMFVSVGILLWLLATSLSSPVGFAKASNLVDGFVVKFILWGILTALAYHICGGIRHLLMDLKYFEELESGALTAKVVFGATAVLSVLAGVLVW